MALQILFVDDQPNQVKALASALAQDGHSIDHATDLAGARRRIVEQNYSLIVLDREIKTREGLEDGLSLCREFRSMGASCRIVFYTNLVSPSDHREGWAAGADDYIEKTWPHDIALARCKAHLSRVSARKSDSWVARIFSDPRVAEVSYLVVDEAALVVSRREDFELVRQGSLLKARMSHDERERYKRVKMTDLDLAVFFALYKRPNEWVTEEELLREVWGYSDRRIESMMTDPDTNSGLVHTTISRIRRKVDTRLERHPESASRMDNLRPWAFVETNSDPSLASVSFRFAASRLSEGEFAVPSPLIAKSAGGQEA